MRQTFGLCAGKEKQKKWIHVKDKLLNKTFWQPKFACFFLFCVSSSVPGCTRAIRSAIFWVCTRTLRNGFLQNYNKYKRDAQKTRRNTMQKDLVPKWPQQIVSELRKQIMRVTQISVCCHKYFSARDRNLL